MIKIKITGGLGNQMFQYALGKALSKKYNTALKLDISGFEKYKLHKYSLECFNINKKYTRKNEIPFYENFTSKIFLILKIFFKKINKKHYTEKTFSFDPNFLNIKSGYIEGYFQSEKYFINYEKEIRKSFDFIIHPTIQNQKIIKIINSTNSISIHIRRGDFINNPNHGICNINYYKKAINYIKEKNQNPNFFFFSDDIDWVKENITIKEESYYIDFNNAETNYEDIRLMSLCKHNIIANSSFSWWGAWLNKNKNKIVIAPKRWSQADNKDRIPYSWITL